VQIFSDPITTVSRGMGVDVTDSTSAEQKRRLPQMRLGAIIALALVAGVVTWLLLREDDDESTPNRAAPAAAVPDTTSLSALRARAAEADQPIYWAGRIPGRRFEVTETPERIYVRYLPRGAKAGTDKAYLTVATYRHANAFAATQTVARHPGTTQIDVGPRGVAFYARGRPTNVYLAYRGSPYQIEVFHPVPRIARQLVSSRRVRPIPTR
jgi:hypothetical protein